MGSDLMSVVVVIIPKGFAVVRRARFLLVNLERYFVIGDSQRSFLLSEEKWERYGPVGKYSIRPPTHGFGNLDDLGVNPPTRSGHPPEL